MSIKIALREATKARHHQHKFGAVLLRGGKPIVACHNFDFVHAEHAVINRAWRNDIVGATLLVIRVRKDGSLGMAKPCELCMNRLIQAGIKKVTYSNVIGVLESIKLGSMSSSKDYLEYHFIDRNKRQKHNA